MKTVVTWICFFAAVISGIGWVLAVKRLNAAESELSALGRTVANMREKAWERSSTSSGEALRGARDPLGPAHDDPRDDSGFGAPIKSMVDDWVQLVNSPEAQELMSAQYTAEISSRYANVFRALQLSPDTLKRFKDLLLERQRIDNDAIAIAFQKGINPLTDPQAYGAILTNVRSDIDSQIQQTLGENKFRELQQYQSGQQARSTVNQLAQSLSYTQDPLTQDQRQAMQSLLGMTSGGSAGKQRGRITAAVAEQAKSFLRPSQMDAVHEIMRAQDAQDALAQIRRNAQSRRATGK